MNYLAFALSFIIIFSGTLFIIENFKFSKYISIRVLQFVSPILLVLLLFISFYDYCYNYNLIKAIVLNNTTSVDTCGSLTIYTSRCGSKASFPVGSVNREISFIYYIIAINVGLGGVMGAFSAGVADVLTNSSLPPILKKIIVAAVAAIVAAIQVGVSAIKNLTKYSDTKYYDISNSNIKLNKNYDFSNRNIDLKKYLDMHSNELDMHSILNKISSLTNLGQDVPESLLNKNNSLTNTLELCRGAGALENLKIQETPFPVENTYASNMLTNILNDNILLHYIGLYLFFVLLIIFIYKFILINKFLEDLSLGSLPSSRIAKIKVISIAWQPIKFLIQNISTWKNNHL